MASVTQRISEIKQPRGGFIKPSAFEKLNIMMVMKWKMEIFSQLL